MHKNIMILGTASSAGKSLITTALCRIFYEDGFKVTPFKSQNMSLNSFVTKDGYFKLTNLYLGKYCLIETKTVGNHVLNSKPYCFEIKYKDQYTDTIKLIINQKN